MRLFVAVWPPPGVLEVLDRLPRPEVPGVRWTTPGQWHVTLLFLGEVPDRSEARGELAAALRAAAEAGPGPVDAVLGPATRTLGPQVLCVPVAGLEPLAGAVGRALGGFVEGAAQDRLPDGRPRPFRGHLTLARARHRHRIPRALAGTELRAAWPVDRLSLVASRHEPGGSVYTALEEVSLGAATALLREAAGGAGGTTVPPEEHPRTNMRSPLECPQGLPPETTSHPGDDATPP